MRPRLCVDIDNVLAKTDDVMRRVICDVTRGRVNLLYEDVVQFKYQNCSDCKGQHIVEAEWRVVHDQFSIRENLMGIAPVSEAVQCLNQLSSTFAIHIVTSRLPKARSATIDWLEHHFAGLQYGLHFVSHGEKHLVVCDAAAAVEDDYDQAVAFAERGVRTFLVEHPWNRAGQLRERMMRCHRWADIMAQLLGTC